MLPTKLPTWLPTSIRYASYICPCFASISAFLGKGVKFYYTRNILHDYLKDKCHLIIKNIIDAMEPNSVIVIDDMKLPNTGS